jgi:hypothetical protein
MSLIFKYGYLEGKTRDDFLWGIPGVAQPRWIPVRPIWDSEGSTKRAAGTGETNMNRSVDSNSDRQSAKQQLKQLGERLKR